MPGPFSGLSVKLIATITLVILAVEVIVYLPSIANFRASWLDDRLRVGVVAASVLDAVPDVMALPADADRPPADLGRRASHRLSTRRGEPADRAGQGYTTIPTVAVTADLRKRDQVTLISWAPSIRCWPAADGPCAS
jgi:hypothetical protein